MTPDGLEPDDAPEQPEPVAERVQLAYGLVAVLTLRPTAPPARKPPGPPRPDDAERLPYVPPPWL